MMFRFLFLCALIVFAMPAVAAEKVFRGMMWGASKEDVKKFETGLFDREEGDRLYFYENSKKERVLVTYEFIDGKFWRGTREYRNLQNPSPQGILDMAADAQVTLEKALGRPSSEALLWNDNEYQYYPQFWGRALRSGDLRIRSVWETLQSRIMFETYYDGYAYQMTTRAEWRAVADAQQNEPYLLLQGANGSAR